MEIKRGYVREEPIHGFALTADVKSVGVRDEDVVGWFSNKYNPAFGWYLYKPSAFTQREFGTDVFRSYSEKLGTWAIVKINPEKGTYAFIDNKAYENEGVIRFEKFSPYLKLVIEPTDTALEMFGMKENNKMARNIKNNGIHLKEGQTVLDVDGNEYLIEKGDILQESSLQERNVGWRLPTKDELNLMYENLHLKGIGGFADDYYWSSSDSNSYSTQIQDFLDGDQYNGHKDGTLRARVVRPFKSQEDFEIGDETVTGFVFDIQDDMIFICKKQDEPNLMTWHEAMKKFGA